MEKTITSHSETETKAIAFKLIEENIDRYRPLIIALKGDLGAGKTVFVKGAAACLGIPEEQVSSPTFVIMNVYQGQYRDRNVSLQHLDLYRLNSSSELYSFGWDEFLQTGDISIIEWADKFPEHLPDSAIWVKIKHTGENEREITITIPGSSIG